MTPGLHGSRSGPHVALLAGLCSVLILTLITRKLGTGASAAPFILLVVFGLVALMAYKNSLLRRKK